MSCVHHYRTTLSTLLLLLLLSGCGFTLRGSDSGSLPEQLQQVTLQTVGNNELARLLSMRLRTAGVEVLENNTTAYQLSLAPEQSRERVVSVNNNIRAGEYELTLISAFQFSRNGETILDSGPLSLYRIYEADPTNAAAKTNEAELIKSEMREELVTQIMRRLQNLSL